MKCSISIKHSIAVCCMTLIAGQTTAVRLSAAQIGSIFPATGGGALAKQIAFEAEIPNEDTNIEQFYTEWIDTPGRFQWEKENIDLSYSKFELNRDYQKWLYLNDYEKLKSLFDQKGIQIVDDCGAETEEPVIAAARFQMRETGMRKITAAFQMREIEAVLGAKGDARDEFNPGADIDDRFRIGVPSDPMQIAEMRQPVVAFRDYASVGYDPLSETVIEEIKTVSESDDELLLDSSEEEEEEEDEECPPSKKPTVQTTTKTVHQTMLELTHSQTCDEISEEGKTKKWMIRKEMLELDTKEWQYAKWGGRDHPTRKLDKYLGRAKFLGLHFGKGGTNLNNTFFKNKKLDPSTSFPLHTIPSSKFERDPESGATVATSGVGQYGMSTRIKSQLKERPTESINDKFAFYDQQMCHLDSVLTRLLISTTGAATSYLQPGMQFYWMNLSAAQRIFPTQGGSLFGSNNSRLRAVLKKSEIRRVLLDEKKSLFVVEPFAFTAVTKRDGEGQIVGDRKDPSSIQSDYALHMAPYIPKERLTEDQRQLWVLDFRP